MLELFSVLEQVLLDPVWQDLNFISDIDLSSKFCCRAFRLWRNLMNSAFESLSAPSAIFQAIETALLSFGLSNHNLYNYREFYKRQKFGMPFAILLDSNEL